MNGSMEWGKKVRFLPGRTYLIAFTVAIWGAWFAIESGKLWFQMGLTPWTMYRGATLFLAALLGASLCGVLDRIMRRARVRPLVEAAGMSMLIGSAAAILWMAIARMAVAPVMRQVFDAGGASMNAMVPRSDLGASAAFLVFVAWIAAWLSVSYAEELREKQAEAADALARIIALEVLLGTPDPAAGTAGRIDHLWVPRANGTARISIDDVSTLRAEGDYVRLTMSDGSEFLVRASLKKFEEQLPVDMFVKVHRSAIVNVDHVVSITRRTSRAWGVQLKDGLLLPVGKTHAQAIRQIIKSA